MLKCINYQPPHNEVGSPQTAQFVCFLWLLSFAQAQRFLLRACKASRRVSGANHESDWLSGHPRLSLDLIYTNIKTRKSGF